MSGSNGHTVTHGSTEIAVMPAASVDGDAVTLRRVEQFLERAMRSGQLSKVVLSQVTRDGDARVADWDRFEGIGPENLAEDVVTSAREDSKNLRGVARYAVFVFRGGSVPDARTFFSLMGESRGIEAYVEDPEPPNGQGIVAQHMRHTEIAVHMSLMSQQQIISELRQQNRSLQEEVRRYMNMHLKVLDTYEGMRSEDHRRALEMRRLETHEARKDAIGAQFLILLPLLLKHLVMSGSAKGALQDTALSMQLVSLFGSLEERQLQTMLSTLSPAQQASVIELYRTMRENVKMAEKVTGTSVAPSPKPEDKKEGS